VLIERPAFKAHLRVEIVPGEGVILLSEAGHAVLPGAVVALVAPLLDGRRTAAELAAVLSGQASPADIDEALADLAAEGCLAEGGGEPPSPETAWWAAHGVDPAVARARLAEVPVGVDAVPGLSAEPLMAALRAAGVRVSPEAGRRVVVTDDYLRPELEEHNLRALETGEPWLLVRPLGTLLWLGPVFRPEQTGCWECLAQRLRANREVDAFLARRSGSAGTFTRPPAFTAPGASLGWNLAATAAAAWIAGDQAPALDGALVTLDLRTWKAETHRLTWRPQCPACGTPVDGEDAPPHPLALRSRRKAFTADGGHRVRAPEATIERFEAHVSPITGAVARLARQGGASDGVLHAYAAGLNLARPPQDLPTLRRVGAALRATTGGKGTTDAQARASALCEALERYSGAYRGEEPRRRATFRELGEAAIHPNDCMLFSERQYRERDAWNARGGPTTRVPLPFDVDQPVSWTPVWSLTRGAARWLPTTFCFYNYPDPAEAERCISCSNGNAAGNTLEEAILQGFLELVERDCVALWWYNRLRRPEVLLESFDEPYLLRARARLAERGCELRVLDITSDLGIPTFAAVARRREGPEQITTGFGSHLDPRIAVLRAVTEANQLLAVLWYGVGADPNRRAADNERTVREWMETATVENQPHMAPDPAQAPRTAADFSGRWSDDLLDDVRFCQSLVEERGMELLVLDQTRPDIGLPVVKVFVPGLRHFWTRFAPGRLYDVPVRMGWVSEPVPEDQLNPIGIFT
jgi:bacteriocin biosynthesis cyclodehydratase domain-containing protein